MNFLKYTLLSITTLFFIACGGDTTTTPLSDISSIQINETDTNIYSTDAPSHLNATIYFTDGTNVDGTNIVTWNSTDNTLVSVTNGYIQALKNEGSVEVSICYNDITSSPITINVTKVLEYNISMIDAEANTTGTYDLNAIATFEDKTTKTIIANIVWDTNNSAIVSGEGNTTQIQIVSTGDTNITATLFGDINMSRNIVYTAN